MRGARVPVPLTAEEVVNLSLRAASTVESDALDRLLADLGRSLESQVTARYHMRPMGYDARVVTGPVDLFDRWWRFTSQHADHADPTFKLMLRKNLLLGSTTAMLDRRAFARSA